MAKFFLDHNFPLVAAHRLNAQGHQAVTARQLQLEQAEDGEILIQAAQRDEILLTFNGRDFRLLQYAWCRWTHLWQLPTNHHGIIVFPPWPVSRITREISSLLAGGYLLTNELYQWEKQGGWKRYNHAALYPPSIP